MEKIMQWRIQSNGKQDKKTQASCGNDKYVILLLLFIFIFAFLESRIVYVYTPHVISISTRCTCLPIVPINMTKCKYISQYHWVTQWVMEKFWKCVLDMVQDKQNTGLGCRFPKEITTNLHERQGNRDDKAKSREYSCLERCNWFECICRDNEGSISTPRREWDVQDRIQNKETGTKRGCQHLSVS